MALQATDVLNILSNNPIVRSLRVLECDETIFGKLVLKVRCILSSGYNFQVWLHHEPDFCNYSYQLFTDKPIIRWDNAPHYPNIVDNFPHHFHDETGNITSSQLKGNILLDLPVVLAEVGSLEYRV